MAQYGIEVQMVLLMYLKKNKNQITILFAQNVHEKIGNLIPNQQNKRVKISYNQIEIPKFIIW